MGVWIETLTFGLKTTRNKKSLPTWECGLKLDGQQITKDRVTSLPTWECGLKLNDGESGIAATESLPTWECGLKPPQTEGVCLALRHSPRGSVD